MSSGSDSDYSPLIGQANSNRSRKRIFIGKHLHHSASSTRTPNRKKQKLIKNRHDSSESTNIGSNPATYPRVQNVYADENPFGHCLRPPHNVTNNNKNEDTFEQHINYFKEMKQQYDQCKRKQRNFNNTIYTLKKVNTDLRHKIKEFEQKNDSLTKQVKLCHGISNEVNTMDLHQLSDLERKLQEGIKSVKAAREKIWECFCCKDNKSNVVFIDGCSHCTVCDTCEKNITVKRCPRCHTPYTNVKTINVY